MSHDTDNDGQFGHANYRTDDIARSSTPDYSELVKALRAPNSPYKKVGVLREFHNTAADAIERLSVRSEKEPSVPIKPDPVAELCTYIKESIRLCGHGYIHMTCGDCQRRD